MNQRTTLISLLAAMTAGLTGTALAKDVAETIQVEAALDRPVVRADQDESVVVQIKILPENIISDQDRPPINLSLVLDRSGSMQGEKIRQAIAAAQMAVGRLGPRDIVSVITYSSSATTLAESQYATEDNLRSIDYALREISASGGTAMYAGLNRGAAELRRRADEGYINRIVLLSDGLANNGPSSVKDFRSLARAFVGEDIVVSTIGLGNGFNEDVMTTLAEAGQGNTYFVEEANDLQRIFAAELGDALNIAATDIEIIITPRAGVRIKQSLGREAEIKDNRASFRIKQVYGGLEKLALLELDAPRGEDGETRELVDVQVRYVPVNSEKAREQNLVVPVAYNKSEEVMKTAAREDVVTNVITNRLVDATVAAIEYSDVKNNTAGAAEFRQTKEKIVQDYAFMGEDMLKAPSDALEANAAELDRSNYSKKRRVEQRAYEYQNKFQQSAVSVKE